MKPIFSLTGSPFLDTAIALVVAIAVVLAAHGIVIAVLRRLFRARPNAALVLRHFRHPAGWILVFLAMHAVWQAAEPGLPYRDGLMHATTLGLIAAATWLAVAAVRALVDIVLLLNPHDVADNLHARRLATQAKVLGRTVGTFLIIFGIGAALMTFPGVRQFGTTLLASAGVAGLVAGLAVRPLLSNVFAGLQIALTQPIRIDDVVIVEGEWGRIEEINGTFVVVRIWDQRRLVLPLQYFIEQPFQNWTRSSSEILGSVFFWVDYATPVAALRAEFVRLCKEIPEWDGRVAVLQVTDFSERAMQVRGLASSADAGKNWDLRCKLREGMIDFIQREYPQSLPRLRAMAQVDEGPARPEAAARA